MNQVSLPHDMIVEILLRSPVKSLLRFKSVCKLWFSLISDPKFAISHFNIASPTHRLFIKFTKNYKFATIDIDAPFHDCSAWALFKITLPPAYHRILSLKGSCRGFILMSSCYRQNTKSLYIPEIIVWNPATNFCRRINGILGLKCDCLGGLGYDSTSDEYLVVILTLRSSTDIHYFSLKTNSWSYIQHVVPYLFYSQYKHGFIHDCFLNESLHWLVKSDDNDYGMIIIAFNLREKRLSEIELPFDLIDVGGLELRHKICSLRVLGGCLCLSITSRYNSRPEVWTMKKYNVQSSWIKVSFDLVIHNSANDLFPICFTKNGELLASLNNHEELVRLTDRFQLLELCKHGWEMAICGVYRESLLSIPGEEAMEDQQQQQ